MINDTIHLCRPFPKGQHYQTSYLIKNLCLHSTSLYIDKPHPFCYVSQAVHGWYYFLAHVQATRNQQQAPSEIKTKQCASVWCNDYVMESMVQ